MFLIPLLILCLNFYSVFLNLTYNRISEVIASLAFGNISQFLASLGTFFAVIIAYFSIQEMRAQRLVTENSLQQMKKEWEASNEPLLIIPQRKLDLISSSWYQHNESLSNGNLFKLGDNYKNECFLEILNIGLGSAKCIEISWKYNYREIIDVIHTQYPHYINDLEINSEPLIKNYYGDYICHSIGRKYTIYPVNEKTKLDYLLPLKEQKEPMRISIPKALLLLASIYIPLIESFNLQEYCYDEEIGEFENYDYYHYNELIQPIISVSFPNIGDKHFSYQFIMKMEKITFQTIKSESGPIMVDTYLIDIKRL